MEIDSKRDIFTVSRLNLEVRSALEGSFPLLWISGEISNLAVPRSGHIYFSLKDSGAQVRAAMFRSRRNNLRFQPENGMQVIVRAKVTLYEPRGDYQLVIDHMEQAGEGLLRQQVEALKQTLATEGLFADSLKKALPAFPRRIGVITSATGAAVRDVLTVLSRRCPSIPVIIYPVQVQGANAAAEISEMVEIVDKRHECDLLILTRGGGSFEDLLPFNDEQLVRTLHKLSIPLISAVGHEIDTTLCDFVADRRAPTPSAAAEIASPDCSELKRQINQLQQRAEKNHFSMVQRKMQRVDELSIRLLQQHPGKRLAAQFGQIGQLETRLRRASRQTLNQIAVQLKNLGRRVHEQHPGRRLTERGKRVFDLETRLKRIVNYRLQQLRQKYASTARELNTLSPLATLERGYAIVLDAHDHVISHVEQLSSNDRVKVRLSDGSLLCDVTSIEKILDNEKT